jgi:hypothetical protein
MLFNKHFEQVLLDIGIKEIQEVLNYWKEEFSILGSNERKSLLNSLGREHQYNLIEKFKKRFNLEL